MFHVKQLINILQNQKGVGIATFIETTLNNQTALLKLTR